MKKVIGIIASVLVIGCLAFCICWAIINFDVVKLAMSGTQLYTKEDLENAYQDGYDNAGLNEQDYKGIIADLRSKLEIAESNYETAQLKYEEYLSKYNVSSAELIQAKEDLEKAKKDIENYKITLASWETFKQTVEESNKVVAYFEYDGAVILIQQYTPGEIITGVTVPADTDEVKFNGWTVDGASVDLSTYTITEETTFVADLTYYTYYTVTFNVDETSISTQKVLAGSSVELPENPTKDGFEFKGWSIDGETVISPVLTDISASVDYIAVFEEIEVLKPEFTSLELVNDNSLISSTSVYVWSDGDNVYYSRFRSEYSAGGFLNLQYMLNKETNTWEEKTWNGINTIDAECIWTDGENIYYTNYFPTHFFLSYVLNKETNTWEEKTWNGIDHFDGSNIYYIDNNVYLSGLSANYILNKKTDTWEEKTWNGSFSVTQSNVWTDGSNIYYSSGNSQYVLDKETDTWEEKTWSGDLTSFSRGGIWTDGSNIYYSSGNSQYVLDKETDTWEEKTWSGDLTLFFGSSVFTDGENYYIVSDSKLYKFI